MPLQAAQAVLVPAVFGAICGYLLGVNKTAYLVLSLLAILGGYFAGKEHDGAREGALRGLVGGALFGGLILLVHEASGKPAKASLPHPAIILLAITVGVGVILGALGGASRARTADKEDFSLDFSRLRRSEFVGFLGALVLLGSLFLKWFSTACDKNLMPKGCNAASTLHGMHGSFSAFGTYNILQWLLLAACIAPFVLAYIIVRGHELAWRPGEITMIVGMVAFVLVLLNGVILGRPGGDSPHNVEIAIEPGYAVALAGAFLLSFGGFIRQASAVRSRKPPGVL